MRNFLVVLGLLALGLSAWAQNPRQVALASTAIAALGTNTPNEVVSLENTADVALQVNLALAAAVGVNSNITVTLQTSLDLVNWVNWQQFKLLSAGTGTVSIATNYAVGAMPFMRVKNFISANTAAVAGLELWIGTKRIR